MEPKVDFRIQGLSHAAVEQEEDSRTRLIERQVRQVKNNSSLIADLQSNRQNKLISIVKYWNFPIFDFCRLFSQVEKSSEQKCQVMKK